MKMPNFVIIGASKAGTTSLYHYLSQHPQIYMSPVKETNFFAIKDANLRLEGPGDEEWYKNSINNIAEYRELFEGSEKHLAVGEASPTYLHSKQAPKLISQHIPNAKLIAILRNPVDRAQSHYQHFLREGQETESFQKAIQLEEQRLKNGWFWPRYVHAGLYHKQITRYYKYFDKEQVQIHLFEDFKNDTDVVVQKILNFLNVNTSSSPNMSTRHNAGGVPKSKVVDLILSNQNPVKSFIKPYLPEWAKKIAIKLKNANLEEKKEMNEETRERLVEIFRKDVMKLEDLIGRDLEAMWLDV